MARNKETYLYFAQNESADAAGDCMVYPASGFMGIDAASTTAVNISMRTRSGNPTNDSIGFTGLTAGKFKSVCEALAIIMNSQNAGLVVVADEDNAVYHKELVSRGATPATVTIGLDS